MTNVCVPALGALILATACGRTNWDMPAPATEGGTDSAVAVDGSGPWTGIVHTNKLDVLVMVDNSSSMADKQRILAAALPGLVERLAGVEDLHVGVVTSSLGGHGAGLCEDTEDSNDHGELLGSRPRGKAAGLAGDFIEWSPADGIDALASQVEAIVGSAGESGCGIEAQLESVYRFLIDPAPPEDIVLIRCGGTRCATPAGINRTILSQRAAFMRPDSAVAVVLLSDENDCSVQDSAQYYYAAAVDVRLPLAAAVCDANPNDPCCYSCGLKAPKNCTPDPICGPPIPTLDAKADAKNLRCFDQRRRFGVDFLYPVERYVNAFTQPTLCTTRSDLDTRLGCPSRLDRLPSTVMNPLFASGKEGRDPSLVHVLGIVGVPWQNIAVDSASTELHYRPADDLVASSVWEDILGEPNPQDDAPPIQPLDPHMRESIDARKGLPGPNADYMADPIHGHDRNIVNRDDVQHACIFELPKPCSDCECSFIDPDENNPICQTATRYERIQHFGRAFPSVRELSLVKGLGAQGSVASICPRNLSDKTAQDYGYRPAIEALAAELAKNVE